MQNSRPTSSIVLSFVRSLLLFAALLLLTMPLYAAPSDLDPTWGGDGIVEVDFDGDGEGTSRVHKAAADPDGKIVVIGNYADEIATIAVTRFNPNGQPDTNFGTDGTTFVPLLSPDKGMGFLDFGQIDFQSNGKLIIVGVAVDDSYTEEEPSWSLVIIRLNRNGSLDTSFGSNGYTLIYPSAIEFGESNVIGNDYVIDLDIQPDDKIVLQSLGLTNVLHSILTRLNADGTLDTSFGGNGVVAFDGYLSAFEIQNDGKIVVGMNSFSLAPIPECANSVTIFVSRINTDGSPDLSFGENGIRQLLPYWHEHGGICDADNSYYHELRDLNILPDSQIIVNGFAISDQAGSQTHYPYFVRLIAEGDPDPTFDTNGILIGEEGYRYIDTVVQANGKLLTTHGNGLSRHHSGGNLDTTWNGTGRSSIPGGGGDSPATDLLPNGNLMLSVLSIAGNAPADNRVFRIIGDPAFGYMALSPQHRQKQVSTKANLKLTFPEAVTFNTGKIEIRRVSDFSLFETISVTDGARVTGGGTKTITINPSVDFEQNTKYYVLVDPNTFTNASGHPFSGVHELTEWHFTTGLTNLVQNAGFEDKTSMATRPALWTRSYLTASDRRICNVDRDGKPDLIYAHSGKCAFRFKSNTVRARGILQYMVLTNALAGKTLNISAFVRTNNLTSGAKVQVMLTYVNVYEPKQTFNLNIPLGTKPYRKVQKSFVLPKDATSAQVRIVTKTSKGTLLIDDLKMTITASEALTLPAVSDLRGQ